MKMKMKRRCWEAITWGEDEEKMLGSNNVGGLSAEKHGASPRGGPLHTFHRHPQCYWLVGIFCSGGITCGRGAQCANQACREAFEEKSLRHEDGEIGALQKK
jgi:hypothetical protein